MKLLKKSIAFVLSVLMLASLFTVAVSAASDEETYVIAGVEDLCGSSWEPGDLNNKMDAADGIYTKTYKDVPAKDDYEFKVTNGTWDKCWGVGQDNYKFNVTETCDVTITFDPATETISATGDYVEVPHGIEIDKVIVVGYSGSDPAFLNGVDWQENNDKNAMSTEDGKVYTITYKGVSQGEDYAFKFALNGSWNDNFGALKKDPDDSSLQWNGDSIYFNVEYNKADVTITFDFTNFNYDNGKSGAKYKLDVVETSEPTTPPYIDPTETPPYTDPETVAPTEPGSVEPSTFNEDTADEETTTAPEEQITPGFYVVGSEEVCGVEWNYETPWKYNEPMKLSADGVTYYQVFENIKSSDGNVTDVGSDCYAFKVVYINENGNVTWHPGGFGNNTVVTVAEDDSTVLFQFKLLASRPTEDGTDPEAVLATVYGPEDEKPSDFSMVPYPGEPEETTAPVEEDTTVPETPVTPGFYVVGSEEVCGSEWTWEPWKFNDPMRLSADGETYYQVFENIKSSDGNVTDEGPDIYVFKVVYINENGGVTFHPGGMANNTKVTVAEDDSTVLFQFKLLASRPTKEGADPEAVIATVYGPRDEKPSDFSKVPYPEELEDTTAATEEKTPESITVEDMELTEGLDSYAATDDKTGKLYNRYDLCPKYTLHYSDGSTDEREYDPDNNDGIIYFETNQSIDNEWTPGEYKVKAYYGELETEFNVKINPSPVESVEFEPVSLVEGLDLSKKYIYDDDDNVIDSYYSYDYNLEYEVKLKNDSFTVGRYGDKFYYQGGYYKLSYNDGQSKDNQWKAGDHKIDAIVLGFKTSFTVSIKENPIEKVTVNDISIIKGTNIDEYDSRYDYLPDFTVTLKDGSEIKSFDGRIELDDGYCDMYVEDGQYDNPWEKTGTYKAKGFFGGKYYEFNVNIIESPVKEVKPAALELIEGVDDYYNLDGEHFYRLRVPDFTVVLNNGEELKPSGYYNCVYYNGTKYKPSINDGPYNWKVGETHKAQFSIMGQDVDFDVKVVSSPVEKIEIEPIVLIEGADVYYRGNAPIYRVTSADYYNDERTGDITKLKCKITLKDGQVLESNEFDEIVYNGRTYNIISNSDSVQNEVSPWTVGNSYDFNVYVLGKSAKATVKVVPTPVEKIIFLSDVQVKLNEDGAWSYALVPDDTSLPPKDNGDGTWSNLPVVQPQPLIYHEKRYFEYDIPAPEFKVILKDGTELTSKNIKKNEFGEDIVYYIEYNGTYYGIMFNDDQSFENQWGLGEHEAELNVLGFTQKYKVIVKEELDPVEPEPDEPGTEPVITPDNPGTKPTDPAKSTDKTDNPTVKKKSANPIKVTAKTKTVKAKKLKKKAQKVKALTVKKAKGKVTYKLVKKGTAKKIYKKLSITKKGVIKIKKGKFKKGTYKIKVKITAKGNKLYNKKIITKTIKVKIK
jgi:hypothetical protein